MQEALRFSTTELLQGTDFIEKARTPRRPSYHASRRGLSLTVRGLRKSFGNNSVLRGIDLHILAGQFAAIVGRSGCGKSTLLRLIAGLERPDAGTIGFDEETVPKTSASCSRSRGCCRGRGRSPISRSASAATGDRRLRRFAPRRR